MLVNSIGAPDTTRSCLCVKTQHGISYGHFHSCGSLPPNSWSRIHSYVVEPIAMAPTSAMKAP